LFIQYISFRMDGWDSDVVVIKLPMYLFNCVLQRILAMDSLEKLTNL
jgi:hypothetical protein